MIDTRGEVIPGLYCAGESQGGFAQHGLTRCIVFGRIAGRHAARVKVGRNVGPALMTMRPAARSFISRLNEPLPIEAAVGSEYRGAVARVVSGRMRPDAAWR